MKKQLPGPVTTKLSPSPEGRNRKASRAVGEEGEAGVAQ